MTGLKPSLSGSVPNSDATHPRRIGTGRRADQVFSWVSVVAGLSVLAALLGVVVATTTYAWPVFDSEGVGFLTGRTWSSRTDTYGALPLIYGTVVTSTIAVVIAVPVSIGVALFTTESCPRWLRGPLIGLIDLSAAVPSVVFGLVGVLVFRDTLQAVYQSVTGPTANGSSFLTAGIVVALMIIPIITSIARNVIETVPAHQTDAAYALGATRWEVIRSAILPASMGGITGAVMLGLGRAMGETIAVALVIGGSAQITADVTQPGATMASIIANTFNGEGIGLKRHALMGLGVVLFGITVVVNMVAQLTVNRAQRRLRGLT